MKRKLLALALLLLVLPLLPVPSRSKAMPGYVKVEATLLDVQRKPVGSGTIMISDANHRQVHDPDEVIHCSGEGGKVSYSVPRSSAYYVQAFSQSYLPSEVKKVAPTDDFAQVTFHLKRAPLPSYPLTTVRVTVLDRNRRPVDGAFFDVSSASGCDTHNLRGLDEIASDPQGHAESVVRAGGVLHVRVIAGGYDPVEKIVRAKPGVVSLVFVLRRNGEPLQGEVVVSP